MLKVSLRLLIGFQASWLVILLVRVNPWCIPVSLVALGATYLLLDLSEQQRPWVRPPDDGCLCRAPRPYMCPVHSPSSSQGPAF